MSNTLIRPNYLASHLNWNRKLTQHYYLLFDFNMHKDLYACHNTQQTSTKSKYVIVQINESNLRFVNDL